MAVAAVVEVMVTETAEEVLTMLHHIRAATILATTMEDITRGAEAHREDAVEVEATELFSSYRSQLLLLLLFFSIICFLPICFRFRTLRCVIRYLKPNRILCVDYMQLVYNQE